MIKQELDTLAKELANSLGSNFVVTDNKNRYTVTQLGSANSIITLKLKDQELKVQAGYQKSYPDFDGREVKLLTNPVLSQIVSFVGLLT